MPIRAFVVSLLAAASAAAAAPPPPTLIENVAVFDGTQRFAKRSVLLAGGKIADADFRGSVPAGARVVDGAGKTLLPGLIDAHVHAFQGQDDALLFGVTTQLDMFAPVSATADVRARMKAGTNGGAADIFTAGILATVPGGHGTEYGLVIPTLTTPQEADAFVAARLAEGSDYIKIIDEAGSAARPTPTLDAATIRALVVATHKRGKLAVAHAQTLAAATRDVEAGVDGLAHLFIDKDGGVAFASLAKARKIFVVPTYTVFEVFRGRSGSATLLDRPALAGLLPEPAVDTLRQTFGTDRSAAFDATEAANLAALVKAGVPILAGTDAGNPGTWYGLSLHRELDLLVRGGLTPAQALTAATAAPAKAFRLADRGRIARGLKADLLLVDGDPVADIGAVHAVVEVWKDGVSANPLRAARRAALAAGGGAAPVAKVALPADERIATFAAGPGGAAVITSPFGLGWAASTDAIAGGKSTVALTVAGAAPNYRPALVMTGTIAPPFFAPWAGVAFNPAAQPFQPVDLSAASAIRFWVRGEGKSFCVMGFSSAGGQAPSVAALTVTAEWREVTVKFADLPKFDATGATLMMIGANQVQGPFRLEIADVRLVN